MVGLTDLYTYKGNLNMPNQNTTPNIVKDGEGNIIGCPKCGSRSMHKDGFQYWKTKKRQRWKCNSCRKKTLVPVVLEENPFKVEDIETDAIDINELIEHRLKLYKQKTIAKNSRSLININININGPIGIAHFGDPHVDDDGTDLSQIIHYTDVINKTPGMFAGNLGDIQNNWVGRLSHLYGQQSTSAKESWRLSEYFVNKLNWIYLVAGNHDVWSGEGDPLDFIMRDHKGLHVSGYQVLKDPASGIISHALQVASFKIHDNYAEKLGLDDKNIFNCPVTIIDPRYEDHDNRLITTLFNPIVASEYLNFLRSDYGKTTK